MIFAAGPSGPDKTKQNRTLSILLTSVLIWGAITLQSRSAQAESGNFWETVGVGIVFGTVLGASTLPFYDSPGEHLGMLGIGAAFGAVLGITYFIVRGSSDSVHVSAAKLDINGTGRIRPQSTNAQARWLPSRPSRLAKAPQFNVSNAITVPMFSLTF